MTAQGDRNAKRRWAQESLAWLWDLPATSVAAEGGRHWWHRCQSLACVLSSEVLPYVHDSDAVRDMWREMAQQVREWMRGVVVIVMMWQCHDTFAVVALPYPRWHPHPHPHCYPHPHPPTLPPRSPVALRVPSRTMRRCPRSILTMRTTTTKRD